MITTTARPHRPGVLGVLYAEDFDDDAGAAPAGPDHPHMAEPEIIEPVFTAAEVERARLQARQAGQAEAEGGVLAARNRLLGVVASGLADARSAAHEAAATMAEGVARAMLSALAACLPKLCQRHGELELRALVAALLPALCDEPKILLRVHPAMADGLLEDIGTLDAELAEQAHVLPTGSIPPGDVRITWEGGSAVRDAAAACAAFKAGLAALGLLEEQGDA